MYYTVPAYLQAQTSSGAQTFAACYVLHLSQPAIQDNPPFQPLSIERGEAKSVPASTSPADALASACSGPDYPTDNPLATPPVTKPGDIQASNYLDDRSTPNEVLASLFNAINRKEYDRAYSYWEIYNASAQPGPYAQFKQGYADTASVQLATGIVTEGVAAGNLYYSVPVVLTVQTTSGGTQLFAGCYLLHEGQPRVQATPPFRPLAIQSAKLNPVPQGSDPASLLNQTCQPQ